MKTIAVSEHNWKQLAILKIMNNAQSINEVVSKLLNSQGACTPQQKARPAGKAGGARG